MSDSVLAGGYPTNSCVALKQKAAGKFCQSALKAWAKYQSNPDADPSGTKRDATIDKATTKLTSSWGKAEAKASKKQVDCVVTTVTAGQADANLRQRVADLKTAALVGLNPVDAGDRKCGSGILKSLGKLCSGYLKAESKFIKKPSKDKDRSGLAAGKSKADGKFQTAYARAAGLCSATPALESDLVTAAAGASDASVSDTISSPSLPTVFTQEIPDVSVSYKGKTLSPRCSRDTPYSFFYKRGTVNNLLVYYQGGGACWDLATCWALPVYKIDAGAGDNPDLIGTGFADPNNPLNIFKDWNVVFVSYCTGDVHWGENDKMYSGAPQQTLHRGRVNAAVAEKFAREHFPSPDKVFVTGSSAGAYGAVLNSAFLMDEVYPASEFGVLGDAGAGVITQQWLENKIQSWNIEKNLPTFIPGIELPLSKFSIVQVYEALANAFPQNRFAQYQTNYDGGNGGQTSFFHIMRVGVDTSWWEHQCEWTACMRQFLGDLHTRVPSNFRSYTGAGSRHTVYGADKAYTDLTGPVPITVRDWVQAMINDDVGWVDVDCLDGGDCDLLDTCQGGVNAGLACVDDTGCPGGTCDSDPRPNPPIAPYEAGGGVNCPPTACVCFDNPTATDGVNCPSN